ncbi:hypothetical protein CM19_10750 [Candidatus Acidianus copahuensis]|uniref:Uncharacterized protein n=1 Tax=Candidatus Acidianus copahuensis TaxID=1160895 RepID=A0A031LJ49_9CREN|nr:hypothetical protein CM19_10750 [Candidatus Acidianus copahuensis]
MLENFYSNNAQTFLKVIILQGLMIRNTNPLPQRSVVYTLYLVFSDQGLTALVEFLLNLFSIKVD